MNLLVVNTMDIISNIDPGPFFIFSLFPYLFFLYYAKRTDSIPRISLLGFRLTLLFVLMTILLAIIAKLKFGEELTNVDALHGFAESFLTVSDALVVYGFLRMLREKQVKNS